MATATAQKTETVRFVSKARNYRAILLNPLDHPHPVTGDTVHDQKGFTAEFARKPFDPEQHDSDGSFQWPPLPTDEYAQHVNDEGLYVDPISKETLDVVGKLRNHPDFGVRFVEVGPSAAEMQEDQREVLAEITRCIARQDVSRLAEIYAEEEAGYKRDAVLTAAMEGMKAVEGASS